MYHFFFFKEEIKSHEWNENQLSLTSRAGAGSLPEMLFQNTCLKFSLSRGKGEREFWNFENLWGLSLAQTPHYRALDAERHESPGGQGDHGEGLHESRSVERNKTQITKKEKRMPFICDINGASFQSMCHHKLPTVLWHQILISNEVLSIIMLIK